MVGMLEGGRMERLVKRIPKVGKYFFKNICENIVENIFEK